MKCRKKIKRYFWSKGIVCGGTLVKLNDYYVCDKCCKDKITFAMISKISQEERGAYSIKPKGHCVELTHPEFSGYYKFEETYNGEWRKKFTLFGNEGKKVVSLEIEDYTGADFMVGYKGPYYLLCKGYDVLSLEKKDIIFYK